MSSRKGNRYESLEAMLLAKSAECPETGCWIWLGSRTPKGYGRVSRRIGGKVQGFMAHRVAYEVFKGVQLPPGMEVHHRCYVTCCINPAHLGELTKQENVSDANRRRFWKPG